MSFAKSRGTKERKGLKALKLIICMPPPESKERRALCRALSFSYPRRRQKFPAVLAIHRGVDAALCLSLTRQIKSSFQGILEFFLNS